MRFRFTSLALLAVVSAAAHADTITFTLSNPTQAITTSGGTLSFSAIIAAPASNTGNEYLNGDSFNVSAPLTLNDTAFFANTPAFLTPGQTFSGTIFTVAVPAGTAAKSYSGSFSILGGASGNAYSTLGTQNFTVNVAAAAVTPEPSSLLLLGTGMIGAVATFRRRVVSFSR